MAGFWRLAGATAAALTLGAVAGNAAMSGMIGLDDRYALPSAGAEAAALSRAAEDEEVLAAPPAVPADAACADCGYAAGWRWAERRDLRDDEACRDDDAAFMRGCIAYVSGGTLPNS